MPGRDADGGGHPQAGDAARAMPAVDIEGRRIYFTEADADALTVAGAVD
ncbi:DUF3203 family protein [Pseudomonas sp. KB_15]